MQKPSTQAIAEPNAEIAALYQATRRRSLDLAAPLSPEDQMLQSMTEASPTKWHLAHTTWFFETFLLRERPDYSVFDPSFHYLFNSYYEAEGPRHPRPQRAMLSRPDLDTVHGYRAHVDQAMADWLAAAPLDEDTAALVELGCHHEMQHQELILTDIKHAFFQNRLLPAYAATGPSRKRAAAPVKWLEFEGGLQTVGHAGRAFAFDCETPAHTVYLAPFRLASRPVTNGEFLGFIEDGGYTEPTLWLSDGWDTVAGEGWRSPLYWIFEDGAWFEFTLGGKRPLDPDAPVCHLSFYEAEAFARWAGKRLPREEEWEVAANSISVDGRDLSSGRLHPEPAEGNGAALQQIYGDVWEWTASPYVPYPGYREPKGAVGEYNGKFMCNQMVLRGGSCLTPPGHIRASYRNFFYPDMRWQMTGLRLAEDA